LVTRLYIHSINEVPISKGLAGSFIGPFGKGIRHLQGIKLS